MSAFVNAQQRPGGRSIPLRSGIAGGHEIDIVRDLRGLRELRSEWDEIACARNVEPWQSYGWIEASAVAYGQGHALHIITVRKHGRLKAIAPMVLKRSQQPLRPMQLHFLGGEELKEPNRLIACDKDSLDLLFDVIVSEPRYPIRLSRIQNHDGMLGLILKKMKRVGWITKVLHMPYPYIDLKGTVLEKSLKCDLRRARRRADALGHTSFELVSTVNEMDLPRYLSAQFRIEASGWKGLNKTAILSNPARKLFFERYAHASLREGILRLCFLLINKEPVAAQYAIESKNACWLLNIGYDEKFKTCSPGNLLLEMSIEAAAQNRLARYNLLGKEEFWTRRWTKSVNDCYVVEAYRHNLHGVRAMISDALYMFNVRLRDRKKSAHKRTSSCNGANGRLVAVSSSASSQEIGRHFPSRRPSGC